MAQTKPRASMNLNNAAETTRFRRYWRVKPKLMNFGLPACFEEDLEAEEESRKQAKLDLTILRQRWHRSLWTKNLWKTTGYWIYKISDVWLRKEDTQFMMVKRILNTAAAISIDVLVIWLYAENKAVAIELPY